MTKTGYGNNTRIWERIHSHGDRSIGVFSAGRHFIYGRKVNDSGNKYCNVGKTVGWSVERTVKLEMRVKRIRMRRIRTEIHEDLRTKDSSTEVSSGDKLVEDWSTEDSGWR